MAFFCNHLSPRKKDVHQHVTPASSMLSQSVCFIETTGENYHPGLIFNNKAYLYSGGRVSLTHEELDNFIVENSVKISSGYSCNICQHISPTPTKIARHIESWHVTLPPLQCSLCNKYLKTRDSLRQHELKYHPGSS